MTRELLEGVQKRGRVEGPNTYFIYMYSIPVAPCRVVGALQLHIIRTGHLE
jgi:hypothetical protein